jgi:hypothetical protein
MYKYNNVKNKQTFLQKNIEINYNNETLIIKEFPDNKSSQFEQQYKQRIILNKKLNNNIILKHNNSLIDKSNETSNIINIDDTIYNNHILDITHFLFLKDKHPNTYFQLYFYLLNNIISADGLYLFNLYDESACLRFLNKYKLVFHYNADTTRLLHLHIFKNDIYNDKILSTKGASEFRNINAYFIYLNFNHLPYYRNSIIQSFYVKELILSYLNIPFISDVNIFNMNGGNKIIHLNNNFNINFINYKKPYLSIAEFIDLTFKIESYHTKKNLNIKYFKDYPNDVIPSDILINKILNNYKIKNYLHITHHIENKFRLEDINENTATVYNITDNLFFDINITNFDCIILNPIRAYLTYIKSDFYYDILFFRLNQLLNKMKNIKLLVIRLHPCIILPYTINSICHIASFSSQVKLMLLDMDTDMILVFKNIKDFNLKNNDLESEFKKLNNTINNISNEDILNEIANAQLDKNTIGSSYYLNINIDNKINDYKINIIDFPINLETTKNHYCKKIISKINYKLKKETILFSANSLSEIINKKILSKLIYETKYNIQLSDTYKRIIAKDYKKLSYNFFSPKDLFKVTIINDNNEKYEIKKIKKDYSQLNYIFEKLEFYKEERQQFIKKYGKGTMDYYKSLLKQNRGSLKFILFDEYKTNFKNLDKINDAYLKMFEILSHFDLINIKKEYHTFHFAEAPGGFILATNTFIKILNKDNSIKHDWYGNSYNPSGRKLEDILKTGKGFDDVFGLMKRHPDRWLFGKDNTGDITKVENILNIRDKFKNTNLDLITGDAGLGANENISQEDATYNLQKLDYAQMVLVANIAKEGTNCCIKCFTNYMKGNDLMNKSFGLYLSIIKMYTLMFEKVHLVKPSTSADDSGEYYIIGINFINIDDNNRKKLLEILEKFETNITFLELEDDFIEQCMKFYNQLVQLNTDNVIEQNLLSQCNDKNVYEILKEYLDFINCKKYFDKKIYDKKVLEFNKNWISENKFKLTKNIIIDL